MPALFPRYRRAAVRIYGAGRALIRRYERRLWILFLITVCLWRPNTGTRGDGIPPMCKEP